MRTQILAGKELPEVMGQKPHNSSGGGRLQKKTRAGRVPTYEQKKKGIRRQCGWQYKVKAFSKSVSSRKKKEEDGRHELLGAGKRQNPAGKKKLKRLPRHSFPKDGSSPDKGPSYSRGHQKGKKFKKIKSHGLKTLNCLMQWIREKKKRELPSRVFAKEKWKPLMGKRARGDQEIRILPKNQKSQMLNIMQKNAAGTKIP